MASYEITSDRELMSRVRGLTGYEDMPDELPIQELESIVETAKLNVDLEYGSTDWYSDKGLGLVLLGTTCIYAKAQVENYSVQSYSIGDESVEVQDAGPEDSAQFQTWANLVSEGAKNSDSVDTSFSASMTNTSDYIG